MAGRVKPRFAAGERVRILDLGKPGHVRTPAYVRGRIGTIERFCGLFENPEERAYGREGRDRIPLYRVHLAQRELWSGYGGNADDTLEIEIYEHWLAPVCRKPEVRTTIAAGPIANFGFKAAPES